MSELEDLLDVEGAAAEAAEADQESPGRTDVKVTRGHDRTKTLQIRLNEDELDAVIALAKGRGLPVTTSTAPRTASSETSQWCARRQAAPDWSKADRYLGWWLISVVVRN